MDIILILQGILVLSVVIVSLFLLRSKKTLYYMERIGDYGIDSVYIEKRSLFSFLIKKYKLFSKKLTPLLSKSSKGLKNNDFMYIFPSRYNNPVNYMIDKLFLGISFVLVCFITGVIVGEVISLVVCFIAFCIGYFSLDMYVKYKKKSRVKLIREDLLKAIIIMNSVFKAGKTTVQALKIAADELPYPINIEFEKMYQDITYGLPLDVVFERFSKRVNIEEAKYISSSLTILQKTGGNIVKVFNSIERSLFDKKKLREELKNLTVNSNMIVKVLMGVPFVFVGIITLLNPTYFNPLFDSSIGFILLGIMILMLSIYIFVLNKIMKVRI